MITPADWIWEQSKQDSCRVDTTWTDEFLAIGPVQLNMDSLCSRDVNKTHENYCQYQ